MGIDIGLRNKIDAKVDEFLGHFKQIQDVILDISAISQTHLGPDTNSLLTEETRTLFSNIEKTNNDFIPSTVTPLADTLRTYDSNLTSLANAVSGLTTGSVAQAEEKIEELPAAAINLP